MRAASSRKKNEVRRKENLAAQQEYLERLTETQNVTRTKIETLSNGGVRHFPAPDGIYQEARGALKV